MCAGGNISMLNACGNETEKVDLFTPSAEIKETVHYTVVVSQVMKWLK